MSYIHAVRLGHQLAALLMLLSLLFSLGDYPYVDEFFPDQASAQSDDQPDDDIGDACHRIQVVRGHLVLANLAGLPATAMEVLSAHSPQVPAAGMQPHLSVRDDRIERPPA